MKQRLLMAGCLVLFAPGTYAQSPPAKDCHTLESSGNFIAADETLVDGLVCKVAKTKPTTPAATASSDVVAEASGKPKLFRAAASPAVVGEKLKSATPPVAAPANTASQPTKAPETENDASAQGATMNQGGAQSLADVARAYQKAPKRRPVELPDNIRTAKAQTETSPTPKVQAPEEATAASPAVAEQKTEMPSAVGTVAPAVEVAAKAKPATRVEAAPVVETPAVETHPSVAEAQPAPENTAPQQQAKPEVKDEAAQEKPTAPQAVPVAPAPEPAPQTQTESKNAVPQEEPKPEVKTEAVPEKTVTAQPVMPAAAAPEPVPQTQAAVKNTVPQEEAKTGIKVEAAPEKAEPVGQEAPALPANATAPDTQAEVKSSVPQEEAKPAVQIETVPEATPPAAPTMPAAPVREAVVETRLDARRTVSIEQATPDGSFGAARTTAASQPELRTGVLDAAPAQNSGVSQAEAKTGVLDTTPAADTTSREEVRQALPSTDNDSSDRPQEVKTGIFEAPPNPTEIAKESMPLDPFAVPEVEQATPGPRPGCTRIVSLGSMEKDKLVLTTADWAVAWLERNQKKYPGVCFSNTPAPGVPNYLIVFITSASTPQQIEPEPSKPASVVNASGKMTGTFTTGYGSTWHYTYENVATTTVTADSSDKAQQNLQTQTLFATAYSEQGIPISQHWPVAAKGGEKIMPEGKGHKHDPNAAITRAMSDLLDAMLADLPLQ